MITRQWLTVQDVAELLQVRIETVRRWVRQGELPVLELGGSRTVYRIRPDDLDNFVWQRYRAAGDAQNGDTLDTRRETAVVEGRSHNDTESSTILGQSLQLLADQLPVVTFNEDPLPPGASMLLSRRIATLLGYPVDEGSNNPRFWLECVHPGDRDVVTAELARTDVSGEPFQVEYRIFRRDGSEMWMRIDALQVPDDTGSGMVWEGAIVDVTDRKRAEAALGMRERQQRAVADLGRHALEGETLKPLLQQAVEYVTCALDVEHARILEVLPNGDSLVLRAAAAWTDNRAGNESLPLAGINLAPVTVSVDAQASFTLLSNDAVIAGELAHETRFDGASMVETYGVQSGVSVIIPGLGRPYGVLGAHSIRQRSFDHEDVFFLQAVANVLASTVARTDAQWLTVAEVAEFLQVTEETVRRWIRRSELPALNLGGPRAGYRVYPSDLERFIGDRVIQA